MYAHVIEAVIAQLDKAIEAVKVRDLPGTPRGTLTLDVYAPQACHARLWTRLNAARASVEPRGYVFAYRLRDPCGNPEIWTGPDDTPAS